MKKLLFLLPLIIFMGCQKHNCESVKEEEYICNTPECLIYLQPYEDFKVSEVEKILPDLEYNFGKWLYGAWTFKILEPIPLPKESFVKSKNRYKAAVVLGEQKKILKSYKEVIIGLTHKDICADVHNCKDYGIVGLSFKRQQVCIVSDKRLSNKSIVWKPILHEFMHTFCGADHCKNDDPTCFMKDAKGHGNFGIQDKLCESCLY